MNKKYVICIFLVLIFCFAGCGKQEAAVPSTAETTQQVTETTQPTVATTEGTIPGLEDSEFDDETEPTAEQTQPQTEATEPAETTKPTEASKPSESTKPTEESGPSESTPPATEAPKPQTEYEAFQNMSAADQQAYMESFGSMDAFFDWYNKAKEEYEAANPPIDVGNGSVDMGDLMG